MYIYILVHKSKQANNVYIIHHIFNVHQLYEAQGDRRALQRLAAVAVADGKMAEHPDRVLYVYLQIQL